MSVRVAAEELVGRAAAGGRRGRVLTSVEARALTDDIPGYPDWLAELLAAVPLCGLELGWQAYDATPTFDGVQWLEWCDGRGVRSESIECFPGLAILSAGYVNVASDSEGSGDSYFICVHEGSDPPLYQVFHDVGADADTIIREGRRLVAESLSRFFQSAIIREKSQ